MILPGDTIPEYGTLSYVDELQWYRHYNWYWLQYVKETMYTKLVNGSDAFINANWPLMSKEYKAAVWALMTAEEKQRITRVRNNR